MSRFGIFRFGSDVIVGHGDTPQEASDSAIGQLNEWWAVPEHQLRTADGEPIAKFHPVLTYANGKWVYTVQITFGRYVYEDEEAHTGKTERLA